jgi:F-type H+-transporting ATPase subunit b
MDQTLRQLGELLLGAIPTMVLLLALYGLYHVIVHKPLEAVLAERRKRTQGAIEQARADVSVAAQRAEEYEARLREAQLAIFKALDNRRKQATDARVAAVAEARRRAQHQVAQAKAEIEHDVAAARATLHAESDRIANQIIHTILQSAGLGRQQSWAGNS